MHENARLIQKGRQVLVRRLERRARAVDVARAMGVSVRSVYKWRLRHKLQRFHPFQGKFCAITPWDQTPNPTCQQARAPGS